MKLLSKDTEQVVYKKQRKIVGVQCDCCSRIIPAIVYNSVSDREKAKYFRVTTGHNDWGYDSIDSIHTRDICPECIERVVTEELSKIKTGRKYIEIIAEYAYPRKVWDDEDDDDDDCEVLTE